MKHLIYNNGEKLYKLNYVYEKMLLPWSKRTLIRMKDRGDVVLVDIGNGNSHRWYISENEIERIKKLKIKYVHKNKKSIV